MKINFKNALYVISDSVDVLKQAVDDGASFIQLRDKSNDLVAVSRKAAVLVAFKKVKDFFFILNDYPDLAAAAGADGIHIGQDTDTGGTRQIVGPNFIIGKSTHSLEQGRKAQTEKADYISVGPVYPTPTKPGRPAVGLDYVREATEKLTVPFVAIGGIDLSNVQAVLRAGAQTIGVVRAAGQTKQLINILASMGPEQLGLKINGKSARLPKGLNIAHALQSFNINLDTVVVELNEEIIKKDDWQNILLKENDSIELISFVGGG